MARTAHASLYELIAAQLVQASQVLANSLMFDRLYASYQALAPAAWSDEEELREASESIERLRCEVATLPPGSDGNPRNLVDRAKQFLAEAGRMGLVDFARKRADIGADFSSLIARAGVLHDHLLDVASMAPPDMTRAWRRLEVTDRHARATVTEIAKTVIRVLTMLVDPVAPVPSVSIEYRHFHDGANITPHDNQSNLYLKIPFWTIYMPRIGTGLVAHECAHPCARKFLLLEDAHPQSEFARSLRELVVLLEYVDQEPSDTSADSLSVRAGSVARMMGEVLSDVLAAMVLGPAYIVNIAEYLIGRYPVVTGGKRRADRVPHSLRIQLLLRLHRDEFFAWDGQQPELLLAKVQATVDEWSRTNAESPARQGWAAHQENVLLLMLAGIRDFIKRRLHDPDKPKHPCALILEARQSAGVRAYRRVWQEVDKIVEEHEREHRELVAEHDRDSHLAKTLLENLESLPEVRTFLGLDVVDDGAAASGQLGHDQAPKVAIELGESWSLDWLWLRSGVQRGEQRHSLEQLGAWMKKLVPPSERAESGTRAVWGVVLGAADGFCLRPVHRVRQAARIEPPTEGGLAAYLERRAVVEVRRLTVSGETVWEPGAWSECCFMRELTLPKDTTAEAFIHNLVTARDTGLILKRALLGTGWASLNLFFQPQDAKWRSRAGFESTAVHALSPARSITSIICALNVESEGPTGVGHEPPPGVSLISPWSLCGDTQPMIIYSALRVRETQDIFVVENTAHRTIQPTLGRHDGLVTFDLDSPKRLPEVVDWLFGEIARGRLTRSVTTIPVLP